MGHGVRGKQLWGRKAEEDSERCPVGDKSDHMGTVAAAGLKCQNVLVGSSMERFCGVWGRE